MFVYELSGSGFESSSMSIYSFKIAQSSFRMESVSKGEHYIWLLCFKRSFGFSKLVLLKMSNLFLKTLSTFFLMVPTYSKRILEFIVSGSAMSFEKLATKSKFYKSPIITSNDAKNDQVTGILKSLKFYHQR